MTTHSRPYDTLGSKELGSKKMGFQKLLSIGKQSVKAWSDDHIPLHGAALAFYSVLSIGPVLLIIMSVAGLVLGHDAASGYLIGQMRRLIGEQGAGAIEDILLHSRSPAKSLLATAIGVGTLLFSASGFFGQLQQALNTIWKVPGGRAGMFDVVMKRLLSFGLIAGICLLLLFSLVVSAGIEAFTAAFNGYLPDIVLPVTNFVVSLGVTTLLFAMTFRILPDVDIRWRDVWVGAVITALLFAFGKYLIGLYLGRSAFASTYGAAGSLIALLTWVYYSSQIFFFGAEFTKVYAEATGESLAVRHARTEARLEDEGPSADLHDFIEAQIRSLSHRKA